MKTFVQMHQREAESYGPRGSLEEMWKAVRALGHNRRFFMSTVSDEGMIMPQGTILPPNEDLPSTLGITLR